VSTHLDGRELARARVACRHAQLEEPALLPRLQPVAITTQIAFERETDMAFMAL
jgi:hypothetical protein